MTTILLITILFHNKQYEITREMPNLDICITSMHQLEHFSSVVSLQCTTNNNSVEHANG